MKRTNTASQPYTVLITDDDRGIRETLQEIVRLQGFRPVLATNGDEAIEIVEAEPVHLALLDMHMPRLTGLETLQVLRQVHQMLPAILITAEATMDVMRQAFEAHVFSVIPKPVNKNVVVTTMIRALIRTYGEVGRPNPQSSSPSSDQEKATDESSSAQRQDPR